MPKYGIWQERDLDLDDLAANVEREVLLDAQETTLAQHNEDVNAITSIFAERLTTPQKAVKTGVTARLQPLDENGRPQPIKGGAVYNVGFPLWKAGTAEGWNFWTNEQMTVREFADSFNLMLSADAVWMRDQLLASAFYNGAGYTYNNVTTGDSFTVYGGANGDTVVYDKTSGAATDDHYAAQAAAIADATNPYPTAYDDLIEHPQNAGRIVSFISSSLVATTELLADYAKFDRNLIEVTPAVSAANTDPLFAGPLGLPLSSTMRYRGISGNNYIVEWSNIPAGWIISVAVDADVKPLGMREYAVGTLRGFINQGEPMSRFPYQQNNYLRAAGFAGLNRVGLHVTRVGNGTYAAPTGYAAPIG